MELGEPLTLMTYNLRFANDNDEHLWVARRPLVVELVTSRAPTVLGTQEGLLGQLDELSDGLPSHYVRVGWSRSNNVTDEHCAVFYDSRRLEMLDVSQRWFSATPEVRGSLTWGACPRIMTAVTLRDRLDRAELQVINTHLDHQSAHARRMAAEQLRNHVRSCAPHRPSVVMGDFNAAARRSAVYRQLRETPLEDTFVAAAQPGIDRPTFNNYGPPVLRGSRIDWILVSPEVHVQSSEVDTRNFSGRYGSDHLPVVAAVQIPRPQS